MASNWVRAITSPFRKACTFFNQNSSKEKNSQQGRDNRAVDLHGEVMACTYEDVQVMWSILDKSKSRLCNANS